MKPAAERGRPREFDVDSALDLAMLVFREKGFHAASISDLAQGMQLTAGSIYKAFQDKRTLFLRVFERYLAQRRALLEQRLATFSSGREKLAELLRFYQQFSQGIEGLRGCLVAGSASEMRVLDDQLAMRVQQAMAHNQQWLLVCVVAGQRDGSINAQLDASVVAHLMHCLLLGMRIAGKGGQRCNDDQQVSLALKILD